ncbi:MAG: molybdopterin-dependent oxidoreductase [Polyangiaceae bacterium]
MSTEAWRTTACILCECNCGLQVELGGDDGRHLVRLRGDKRHPASRGYACEKPHRLDYYQHNKDRLSEPLRRRADGSFEAIAWDQAIAEVASRLARIRDEHGGASIFYYGGGGQGNHLPGAYSTATRRALDSRYRSSPLAQEKTGEFWIANRMLGSATRADFEHCDVALFIGKNPWHSHSIARARVTLKELAKDPARTLIVIDPRRTETAALADIHLQVRPGTDAWLLAAILGVLVQEDLLDHTFVSARATGVERVTDAFGSVDVAAFAARAGIDAELVRKAARAIGGAKRLSTMEDLGVQMNRHSTLVSYLHRLLWMLTGNLGKPGTHYIPAPLVDFTNGALKRTSPVVGAPIIGGLVPCNVIADEILTDHPKRYRAMIIESANPVHSLAESPRMRQAMAALDTSVVIDVAMSESARAADYVLPAATQFEKAEATFFNFEFPSNVFHLRRRLFAPPAGALPEAEIHARLCEALGVLSDTDYAPLREAAAGGLASYGQAFVEYVLGNPKLSPFAAVILFRTLGPTLPEDRREGAVLFGLAFAYAMQHGDSVARAGYSDPIQLFQAMLDGQAGIVLAVDEWEQTWSRVSTPDGKLALALDDMLAEVAKLAGEVEPKHEGYPFVLAAGERRSFTANTIMRDPEWRKKDEHGTLRVHPTDAASLGVVSGDRLRVITKTGQVDVVVEVCDSMQPGHVSLPNGHGLRYPDAADSLGGIAPNELTSAQDRDPFVGTPWHKAVPARLERV